MAHVVMQAAEFPTLEAAERCEAELRSFIAAYGRYEESPAAAASPLDELGRRHGVAWPGDRSSRISVKGPFSDSAALARIGRLVFFWIGGFNLGGETMREVLRRLGAVATASEAGCHVVVRHDDPDDRVDALAAFLDDGDFEEQYTVQDAGTPLDADAPFSVTFVGPRHARRLVFDTSGVQDWAFTELLHQLDGDDPGLAR